MELFHTYKRAQEVAFRAPEFFYPFLAPLLRVFYPKSKVRGKPHLKQIEICFTSCALVYPKINVELLAINPDDLEIGLRNHWRNLVLLFEFFIPLVCHCLSTFFYFHIYFTFADLYLFLSDFVEYGFSACCQG